MKKNERLQFIKELVARNPIDTQEEIVDRLKEAGIVATQATVSRDIKELGIIKVPSAEFGYIYGLPKAAMAKIQATTVKKITVLNNMLNLDLIPGSTMVAKRHILERFSDRIFSIVADDDSILIVTPTSEEAQELAQAMKVW